MEVHQLRYFVAVVDEGSFTRAAARVNVSQSGVSAQIRQLERELGQPVIDRSDRRIKLTDTGEAVLPFARAALSALASIREAADDVAGLLRGSVRIGVVTGCSIPGFLDALADVHNAHPRLSLKLIEGSSDTLQSQVLAGDLNLALVGYAEEPKAGLDVVVIIDESLIAAVPENHFLAAQRFVRLDELDTEAIICLPEGTGIRAALDGLCRSERSGLRVDLEASSPEAVIGLVARGLGVAILSASMLSDHPGLRGVPLEPDTRARLGLVWKPQANTPAATRTLLAAMKSALIG